VFLAVLSCTASDKTGQTLPAPNFPRVEPTCWNEDTLPSWLPTLRPGTSYTLLTVNVLNLLLSK